jgi:hypothetical protein
MEHSSVSGKQYETVIIDPEDGDSKFFRNCGGNPISRIHIPEYFVPFIEIALRSLDSNVGNH